MKKALIIVDVQDIFLNKKNKHVLVPISDLLESVPYDMYINAVFHAEKSSIWEKQIGWNVDRSEAKTHASIQKILDKKSNVVNVIKQTKSVFKCELNLKQGQVFTECDFYGLVGYLRVNGVKEIHIIGLDTNDCVLATAYEAFDLGFYTYVIEECVQSSEGNDLHIKSIDLLRHVGLIKNRRALI